MTIHITFLGGTPSMLAERPTTDLLHDEPVAAHDRSMLVMQYLMAGVALVAAVLLAGVS